MAGEPPHKVRPSGRNQNPIEEIALNRALAFRANFRAARAYEDVNLTPLELQVAKVSAKGVKAEWRFHPSWVRLQKEEHEEFGLQKLALVSRGQSVEIADFLGPDEKARFAAHLAEALAEARRGPRFS